MQQNTVQDRIAAASASTTQHELRSQGNMATECIDTDKLWMLLNVRIFVLPAQAWLLGMLCLLHWQLPDRQPKVPSNYAGKARLLCMTIQSLAVFNIVFVLIKLPWGVCDLWHDCSQCTSKTSMQLIACAQGAGLQRLQHKSYIHQLSDNIIPPSRPVHMDVLL